MKKNKLLSLIFVIDALVVQYVESIYDPNQGIKTNLYRQDGRISQSLMHTENQPILMHHQYSQVKSNRPGSPYSSQYSQEPSGSYDYNDNATPVTTTTTNSHENYHGSSKVYQQTTHTSSKTFDIENNLAPYKNECPEGATGQFPYSLDCRRFLNCWKGRGYLQACAPGTVFNPDTLECDNPKKVNCLEYGNIVKNENYENQQNVREGRKSERLQQLPVTQEVRCHPGSSGIQPHPFDCTKFMICTNGLTHIQNCGPGTAFNTLTSVCDFPEKVNCGTRAFYLVNSETTPHSAMRPYNNEQEHHNQYGETTYQGSTQSGHGNSPTGYGNSPTGYGNSPTEYGNSPTGYGNSPTGYGNSQTGYGTSQTGYGSSNTGYGTSQTGYGASQTGYGAGQTGYGASQTGYGTSQTGHGSSSTGYGISHTGYGTGQTGYGSSRTGYGGVNGGYGSATSYGSSTNWGSSQQYTDHHHTASCTHHSHQKIQNQDWANAKQTGPYTWSLSTPNSPVQINPKDNTRVTNIHSEQISDNQHSIQFDWNQQKPDSGTNDNQHPITLDWTLDKQNRHDNNNTQSTSNISLQQILHENNQQQIPIWYQQKPESGINDNQHPITLDWTLEKQNRHKNNTQSTSNIALQQILNENNQQQIPIWNQLEPENDNQRPVKPDWNQPITDLENNNQQQIIPNWVINGDSRKNSSSVSTYAQHTGYTGSNFRSNSSSGSFYIRQQSPGITTKPPGNVPSYPTGQYACTGYGSCNRRPTYVQPAVVTEVPINSYDEILRKLPGIPKNTSEPSNVKIYYAESVKDSDEEKFENIAGGDIPVHSSLNKNDKLHSISDDSNEEKGQIIVPFDESDNQKLTTGDLIASGSLHRESSAQFNTNQTKEIFGHHMTNKNDETFDEVVLIPSLTLRPPYTDREWTHTMQSNFNSQQNKTLYTSKGSSSSIPIPKDHLIPPITQQEEREAVLNSTKAPVPLPPNHMLPPLTPSQEELVIKNSESSLPVVPPPSDQMLPPLTTDEERQKTLGANVPQPSDHMLPPLTSDEIYQKPIGSEEVRCYPNSINIQPHPYDCSKFLICSNGITNIQKCGPGTVFNPLISVCDFPRNVNCGTRYIVLTDLEKNSHLSVPQPSGHMLPPLTTAEERRKNPNLSSLETITTTPSSIYTIGLVPTYTTKLDWELFTNYYSNNSISSNAHNYQTVFNLSPTSSEEVQQKIENPFGENTNSIPAKQMLPPLTPQEERQKIHVAETTPLAPFPYSYRPIWIPQKPIQERERLRISTTTPSYFVPVFEGVPLAPFPNEEQQQSIPSDHMLPPLTSEEELQKTLNPTTTTKAPFSAPTNKEQLRFTTTTISPLPNKFMLPPLTPEEERQKVLNTTLPFVAIPAPSDKMLPPMTPDEERQKVLNFSSKVIPLSKQNSSSYTASLDGESINVSNSTTKNNYYAPSYNTIYSPSYASVVSSKNLSQINASSHSWYGNQNQPLPPQSHNLELEPSPEVVNDSMIDVESPPVLVIKYSTTKKPFYSGYNHGYYQGSSSSSSSSSSSYSTSFSSSSSTSNSLTESHGADSVVSDLPISDAIKALLRPYLNRSGSITDEDIQKTESHIMKLVKTNSSDNDNDKHTSENYDQHKNDVEIIFTGEQSHLNQGTSVKGGGSYNPHNSNNAWNYPHNPSYHPKPSFEPNGHYYQQDNHQHNHFHQHGHGHGHHHGHSTEFHQNNPHMPNPFEATPPSSGNYHFGHDPDFHRRNPHMPNPFTNQNNYVPPNQGGYPTSQLNPPKYPSNSNNPGGIDVRTIATNIPPTRFPERRQIPPTQPIFTRTTTTTTTTPATFNDLEINDCEFDCNNGKCVKEVEVCDGVNNCGNRLDEEKCNHLGYEIRLANEQGEKHLGRIEVKILGHWGYVCDDKFGMADADVVCRELGFPLGASEVRGNSYYPPINDKKDVLFVMDELNCIGNETSLKDCDFKGWGVSDCTAEEVVGVVCKIPVMKCPKDYWLCSKSKECIPPAFVCDNVVDCGDKTDESEDVCNSTVEYRLADGINKSEGRLEVKYRGKWGTICDDDFTDTEAEIACKSLGFKGKGSVIKNTYGSGSGPIWLDQVACMGDETSIDKCIHWTWGEHNCNHTEDVSIRCTNDDGSSSSILKKQYTNTGIKGTGRSAKNPEPINPEDLDSYLYQMERSSKVLNSDRYNQQLIKKCGHINPNVTDEFYAPEEQMQRVVQGATTKRGYHPWQATIRTRGRSGKSTHWCGAVLISKQHLITAAHCLMGYPKGAYFVRLGDHYADIAESSEIDVYIENWYIHEDFRKGSHMNNDIALIHLKSPVRFNDYIQPICLPPKGVSYDVGKMCTISGWGSIQSGISTPSNQLRAAKVPIIDDSVCKSPLVYGNTITEGMFCAGYLDEGVDACDGDSGGPLVCHTDDAETLYGIISWGQHCGYANKPGVYVKIGHYIDWIHDKINFLMKSRRN